MQQYTPMIRQYLEIKADYQDAFLFFRLGDFYELFFDDAIHAAKELEITLTARDGGGPERIPMCGVPYHAAEGYIKVLIEKGYKVAICEQVEDPKEAKGVVRREVVRVITPGTVMESSMLTEENNYLGIIIKQGEQYGLSFCDLTTGEFYAFAEGVKGWISTLEEILPFAPKEMLIHSILHQDEQNQLKSYLAATFTPFDHDDDGEWDAQGWKNFVLDWFPKLKRSLADISYIATGTLMKYLQSTQKSGTHHFRELQIVETNHHLILDPFTRRNLEINETIRSKSKYGSLFWLLDRTITPMGGRLLKRWMDKPLLNETEITQRLDGVQFFTEEPLIREELRTHLKDIYDLERLVGRISYGNVNGRDLQQLRKSLERVPAIRKSFHTLQEFKDSLEIPEIINFIEQMDLCEDITERLQKSIVDDPPIAIKEGGIIKDGFHSGLDELRLLSRDGKAWIAQMEQEERERTGIRSLKVGYNRVFGYYLEVTKANLALVPTDRYVRKQTLTNAERFITEELKTKETLILEAEEKIIDLEYELFLQLREELTSQIPRLQRLARQLAQLDVIMNLAEVAVKNRYVRPMINHEGHLVIKEGRHPVIEAVLKQNRYIPNSTYMNREEQIYLITGPNMAGKSTYMRQVALITLMFQMGSFVPATHAELPIVDRVFTRIGAADDLVEGESTFMVEMNEIKVTTTQATSNSLVIIDELGRGTSTQDGMAIARAVIEYLHDQIGCKTLVSTHFHELATLESELARLKNYHMAVQETSDEILFSRQLVSGATSKSYGIYCAQLAGLPPSIISRANKLIRQVERMDTKQLDLFIGEEKAEELEQKVLSDVDQSVLYELMNLDLTQTTPIQALNQLFELQNRLRHKV